ncbi:MAG: stage III sporulation protein AD [Defluviitaleaceae bacterium]|nr:stage III sporulation protein AD [Defluviitaleaceae bacterium]
MGIIQIVGAALVVTILSILVKRMGSDIGLMVSILGGILIFFMVLPQLIEVISVLGNLAQNIDTNLNHITIILRVIGVAYIAEFGAQICKDAGEGAIASKIELSGKVIIMVMSAPVIVSFLNVIITMLPS